VDVQLLRDEHMARVAGDYLEANPTRTMVLLAGSGHVAYQDANPDRLQRMVGGDVVTLATGSRERFAGGNLDYLFAERDIALDPPGRLGMELASVDSGVSIRQVRTDGPADNAGLRPGDRMRRIDGQHITAIEDVRLALFDRKPGETVRVEVESGGESNPGEKYERFVRLL
jgi:membrane-associated protease RseP (regulator of RpoE activity)